MSDIDNGGTAFPTEYDDRGLSMRDYFAAAALTGFLANSNNELVRFHEVASDAYNAADAMLAARKEGA